MDEKQELIQQSILRDMSEGIMALRPDGVIRFVNPALAQILEKDAASMVGKRFAAVFFGEIENDAFNQAVLDAIYDASSAQERFVPFDTGTRIKQLRVRASFLRSGVERVGVVLVVSDLTELTELQNAVQAMERIRALNDQLELRNRLLNETFGRFLSDEIVRQLLDTPDGLALGGKKQTLTILMSDLRGFTAMSERMEATALITMLNYYLAEMTEIIQRRGGTIIEFIGDGILAIFGAPTPSERHAADAVFAAVEMQARMAEINRWNTVHGFPALQMGIGIHTGEVIVGNIGSEKRTKYGVVGSHVNLCGRIESYTVGGDILISPTTRKGIAEPLEIARETEVLPKGAENPMVLSLVTGIGGITCREAVEPPRPLARPILVRFRTIHEKHVDAAFLEGRFTALSREEALLETDAALAPFDNLELETGGLDMVYCKVLSGADGTTALRFTSTPPEFEHFVAEQRYSQ